MIVIFFKSTKRFLNLTYNDENFINQLVNIVMTLNMSLKSIKHSKFIRLMNMLKFFINIFKRTFFENQIRKKY